MMLADPGFVVTMEVIMQCSPVTWLQFCLDQGLPIQCSEELEPFITVNPVPKPRQKWSAPNQSRVPLPELGRASSTGMWEQVV